MAATASMKGQTQFLTFDDDGETFSLYLTNDSLQIRFTLRSMGEDEGGEGKMRQRRNHNSIL